MYFCYEQFLVSGTTGGRAVGSNDELIEVNPAILVLPAVIIESDKQS